MARYTLSKSLPQKLAAFATPTDVVLSVANVGTPVFIAHDYVTLLRNSGGQQEGTPIVNNGADLIFNSLKWQGDLWALCLVDGTAVDIEYYNAPPQAVDYGNPLMGDHAPASFWRRALGWFNDLQTIVDPGGISGPPKNKTTNEDDFMKIVSGS